MAAKTISAHDGHMVLGLVVIIVIVLLIVAGFWIPSARERIATRGAGVASRRRSKRR